MRRKELTKTFMISPFSNLNQHFGLDSLYKNISVIKEVIDVRCDVKLCPARPLFRHASLKPK